MSAWTSLWRSSYDFAFGDHGFYWVVFEVVWDVLDRPVEYHDVGAFVDFE